MNKTILSIAAVSAIAITAPAASQSVNANAGANIVNRIANIQTEIQAGVQAGTITRAEAPALRQQYRQLRDLERQYSANGLTNVERQDLQRRIQTLRQQVRYASRTNAGNQYGSANWIDRNNDGFDDRDLDRDGRWTDDVNSQYGVAEWIDRNRDGYDDRDTDRDGIWTDNYGQGGPLEEVQQCAASPGGIAGIFNSVLGRNMNTNCQLRVGQRATASLYGVPVDLRDDYRDGNGVYYRSDGRNIYQIDARTNVVLRVYDID